MSSGKEFNKAVIPYFKCYLSVFVFTLAPVISFLNWKVLVYLVILCLKAFHSCNNLHFPYLIFLLLSLLGRQELLIVPKIGTDTNLDANLWLQVDV